MLISLLRSPVSGFRGTIRTISGGHCRTLCRPCSPTPWSPCCRYALVAACALLKRYAPGKLGTWLGTDVGGSLMALATSFFGAIATALASGNTPFSLSLVWTAAHIAAIAAGGYAILKKLAYDPLIASTWYQTKAPAWLKTVVGLIGWVFEDSPAVAAAKAAGDAAVAAAPAPGAVATTGAPTEVK